MRTCNFLPLGRMARAIRRAWRISRAAGGTRECPACGRRVREFLPFPREVAELLARHGFRLPWESSAWETFNREAYTCPFCDATDRERLYALYLRERLAPDLGAGLRLLDIGPSRPMTRFIRRRLRIAYRSADLCNPEADDRVDLADMRIYRDGEFDALLCSHVLEHVPDDRRAMAELFRVLRPGGWGIVMTPIPVGKDRTDEDPGVTDVSERLRRFGQEDHVRIYSGADFTERLQNAGFRVTKLGRGHFGPEAFERCGLTPQSALYVVEKPMGAGA